MTVPRSALPASVLVVALAIAVALTGCVAIPGLSAPKPAPAEQASPAEQAPAAAEPAAGSATLKVGDAVAAKWLDGNMWLAEVTAVENGMVTVKYRDDQTSRTIPETDVRMIVIKDWSDGDRVLAVWSAGRFYPGVITAAKGDSFTVKWDDGSTPTDVEAGKIVEE